MNNLLLFVLVFIFF